MSHSNDLLRFSRKLIGLCCLALAAAPAHAQQFRFRVLGQDDGLLNLNFRSMVQDRLGYLWLGTDNGVFRYDGARFNRFTAKDGLPAAYIARIAIAPDGAIWACTQAGLARFENGRFVPVPVPGEFDFHGLALAPNGDVAVSTQNGIYVLSRSAANGAWTHRRISQLRAKALLAAADGSFWFNCHTGLCRVAPSGAATEFTPAAGVPAAPWRALVQDHRGRIFARASSHLLRLDHGAPRFQSVAPTGLGGNAVLYAGPSGTIITDTADGLAMGDGTSWRSISRANGLPPGDLTSFLEDADGSLWVGINSLGLARWAGRGVWENWDSRNGLGDDSIDAITVDARNRTWVAAGATISILEGHSLRPVSAKPTLALTARGNAVWAAHAGGTLTHWNIASGQSATYGPADGLPAITARGLLVDANGAIWVAALEGLFVGTPNRNRFSFSRLDPPGAKPGDLYLKVIQASSGSIYVATTNGLLLWSAGRWQRFLQSDGLLRSRIHHLAPHPDGSVLVSYSDALGITRFWPRSDGSIRATRHFDTTSGLRSDRVYALAADSNGRIWVGTDRGVDVSHDNRWIHHDTNSGLIWNDTVHAGIAIDARDGVWLGTRRGLAHFLPGAPPASPAPPRVAISSWSLGDQQSFVSFGPGATPAVAPASGTPGLQITLAGMAYLHNAGNLFRYRLHGVDDRWIESSQPIVRYPALRAGHYRFQAYGINDSGATSAAPVELAFTVQFPWWQTPWAVFAACLLLGFLVVCAWSIRLRMVHARQRLLEGAVRSRTATVEKQKAEIEQLLIEARQASQAKSAFLANMSHEIRTPLNGVVGMADLLLLADTLESEQQAQALTLRKSALDLLHLLNDLLDMAKIEAGKLSLELAPFALDDCLNSVANLMSGLAAEKGLTLIVDAGPAPTALLGDSHRLRQVLTNLISNAIKFSTHGAITLRVRSVPCRANHACVEFAVEDHGIGIPADRLQAIFAAFEQAESSTSRRFGGSGLGLAICQELVAKMGGAIHVESEVGKGSRFSFTLELEQLPALPTAAADAPPPATTLTPTLRILLCEDNKVNQRVATRMLETLGHHVTIAADGRAAVDHFRQSSFDVVLMDLMMPEVDGVEATLRIRELEEPGAPRVPIVALTASAFREDIERCRKAGMDGFLSKPFVRQSLVDEVARVLTTPKP